MSNTELDNVIKTNTTRVDDRGGFPSRAILIF